MLRKKSRYIWLIKNTAIVEVKNPESWTEPLVNLFSFHQLNKTRGNKPRRQPVVMPTIRP